jgi:DNA-binding Xre family transcriptional regulator
MHARRTLRQRFFALSEKLCRCTDFYIQFESRNSYRCGRIGAPMVRIGFMHTAIAVGGKRQPPATVTTADAGALPTLLLPKIRVRARAVAVDRGYRFDSSLHKALLEHGFMVSSARLRRFLNNELEHLDTELLEALMALLDCRLGDLLDVTPAAPRTASAPLPQSS